MDLWTHVTTDDVKLDQERGIKVQSGTQTVVVLLQICVVAVVKFVIL